MPEKIIVTHNPRCRKSRDTVNYLTNHNISHEVRHYLKEHLTEKEITDIVKKLGVSPQSLIRKGESIYKESYKAKDLSDKEWIKIMADHPKLIERPIVIKGEKAVIGRPLQNVIDLVS